MINQGNDGNNMVDGDLFNQQKVDNRIESQYNCALNQVNGDNCRICSHRASKIRHLTIWVWVDVMDGELILMILSFLRLFSRVILISLCHLLILVQIIVRMVL